MVAAPLSLVHPIVTAEGHGATLTDVDGNTFIDFTGGVGCLNVGHSHPQVVEAAQEQLAQLRAHGLHDRPVRGLRRARRAADRGGAVLGPAKAAFFNAGTEAVENSIKFARSYTKRPAVIAFEGAFHGRTMLSMTMTSKTHPYKAGLGPFAPEVYRVPYPHEYRGHRRRRRAQVAPARVRDAGARRERGRDRDGADPRRGRLRRRADGVRPGRARDLRRARDRLRRRRGADRLRPHRDACGASSITASSRT